MIRYIPVSRWEKAGEYAGGSANLPNLLHPGGVADPMTPGGSVIFLICYFRRGSGSGVAQQFGDLTESAAAVQIGAGEGVDHGSFPVFSGGRHP